MRKTRMRKMKRMEGGVEDGRRNTG